MKLIFFNIKNKKYANQILQKESILYEKKILCCAVSIEIDMFNPFFYYREMPGLLV